MNFNWKLFSAWFLSNKKESSGGAHGTCCRRRRLFCWLPPAQAVYLNVSW
jgi:hypothetical protein